MGVWGTAALNDGTVAAFSTSAVVSCLIVALYLRCVVRRAPGAKAKGAVVRRRQGDGDWGPVEAIGIDLGSFDSEACEYDGALKVIGSNRSIVSLSTEGFRFGEVDFAKEHAESTFFSLPQDMATGADTVITAGDVEVKPYQACGAMLKWLAAGHQVVAVGVPPYLNCISHDLYLAAVAAGASRLFVFRQSAALMAALLRYRRMEIAKHRPSRHVVFVDAGRSGIAAYYCEVRETAASLRRETFRTEGIREMERRMVADLMLSLPADHAQDVNVMAAVVEAAAEMRYEFASTPAYLVGNSKRSSRTRVAENIAVEMDRERFDEILELAKGDAQEVAQEIASWLRIENTLDGQCDLVLCGNALKSRELRAIFEPLCPWKNILRDKISVAQGLALLAAMRHPKFGEQRYDIDPLYELATLDESGVRPSVEERSNRGSLLSPGLGVRSSSTFSFSRAGGRKSSQLRESGSRTQSEASRMQFLTSPILREAEST